MATCQDIDQAIASVKASQDARFAAIQAQLDACCAKANNNDIQLQQLAASLLALNSIVVGQVSAAIAALTVQIGVLGAQIIAVIGLEGRVDAVEKGLDQTNQGLSNLGGLITSLKSYVDQKDKELYDLFSKNFNELLSLIYLTRQQLEAKINELAEIIARCCKKIDDFTNPNNPNSPMNQCCADLGNKIDNLTSAVNNIANNQSNTSNVVQQGIADGFTSVLGKLNTVLGLINTIFDLVKNLDSLFKQLFGNGSRTYSGSVTLTDCSGRAVKGAYSGATAGEAVLSGLSVIAQVQNQVYRNDCQSSKADTTVFNVQDCFGATTDDVVVRGNSQSLLTQGLYVALQKQIIKSTGYCTNYTNAMPTYDCNTGALSDRFQSGGRGIFGIMSAIRALAQQQSYYFRCVNGLNSGTMSIKGCDTTYNNPYSGYGVFSAVTGALQAQNNVISKALAEICKRLDIPLSGAINRTVCSTPLNATFTGKGFLGVISAMNAYNTIDTQANTLICNEIKKMDCIPYELEPDSKYAERTLSSQIFIRFIDKRVVTDPDNFTKRTAYKCRLVIPNPRTGITCADLTPITWIKGNFFGRINFDIKNINTHNYFSRKDEAENILAIAGALSTNAVTTAPARVTSGTNPLYPDPSVIGIEVIPYYAVITTLVNGVVTNIEKLCCL